MAIYIRNLLSASDTIASARFSAHHLVLIREIFLAGRWTQNAISNPSTWNANIVHSVSDGVVRAAHPGRITSVTGGFTGYEDYGVTLIGGVADADVNQGVFRIKSVVSDNEIEVYSPPLNSWVSDTGMTCRIFNWGITSPLLGSQYVVMDPPTGNNQAYLSKPSTDYWFEFAAHPRGDYPNNQTPIRQIFVSTNARNAMWNAYFDGSLAFVFFYDNYNNAWNVLLYGELEDVATADTYPGFFSYGGAVDGFDLGTFATGLGYLDMLYDTGVDTGPLQAKVTNIIKPDATYSTQQQSITLCREVKGQVQVLKPWVYTTGAYGGYMRGRHPFYTTNTSWGQWRPVTLDGSLRRYTQTGVFPMNGVNDPQPLTSTPAL